MHFRGAATVVQSTAGVPPAPEQAKRLRSVAAPTRRRTPGRLALACALAVVAFALSGCVYLRLLQLKRQLADFDRHFTLQTTDGVRLNCLEPVLLAGDLRWLGFAPATIRTLGLAEQWHIRWTKLRAPDSTEPTNFDIAFDLFFADEKLTALAIPESYFSILPKDVLVNGIRSLGGASVDKTKRSVESQVQLAFGEGPQAWPTRTTILSVLGQPTQERRTDAALTWRYHFVSADPDQEGEDIHLRFVFDPASEKLIATHGRLPVGRIHLNFTEAGQ